MHYDSAVENFQGSDVHNQLPDFNIAQMGQQSGDAGGTDYSSAALGSRICFSESKHRDCPAFASSRLIPSRP